MITLTVSPDLGIIQESHRDSITIGRQVLAAYHGYSVNGRLFDAREDAERFITDLATVTAATELVHAQVGDPTGGYSRDQYEHACRLLDIEPMTDEQCDSYGVEYGVFAPPEYRPDQIMRYTIARYRLRGIGAARKAAAEQAQQAADAIGTGAYTRDQYETACAAAGIAPLDDRAARRASDNYLDSTASGVRAVGAYPTDDVALSLAIRRADGMNAEAAEAGQVCIVCRRPVPAGTGVIASLGRVCDDQDCYDKAAG